MLTNQKKYTLHIDMWDWDVQRFHAEYTNFHVASEDANYRLTVGEFSGDAGVKEKNIYNLDSKEQVLNVIMNSIQFWYVKSSDFKASMNRNIT